MKKRAFFGFILLLFAEAVLPLAGAAPKKPTFRPVKYGGATSQVRFACTDQEEWVLGRAVPSAWGDKLVPKMISPEDAIELVVQAEELKSRGKTPEARAMAEYLVGRALYTRKVVHLAFERLGGLAIRGGAPVGIRLAALSCMNEIHKNYPSFYPPAKVVESFKPLVAAGTTPQQREVIWEAATDYLEHQLSVSAVDNDPAFTGYLSMLHGSGPFQSWIGTMYSAKIGKDADVVRYAEAFLKTPKLPEALRDKYNEVRLMVGEAYYDLRRYDKAAESFKRVKGSSAYAPQALIGRAWAHLMRKEYPDAMSAAQNMVVGALKKNFMPESSSVVAIAFVENCRYSEALETVQTFKKNYEKSYRWLNSYKSKMGGSSSGLYAALSGYLKKSGSIPERIGSAWVRSPTFVANQTELNLIYDEKIAAKELFGKLGEIARERPKWSGTISALKAGMGKLPGYLASREGMLVQQVETDLGERTSAMMASLSEVSENLKLVEAEVYNVLGEKMIADQAGENKNQKVARKDGPRRKDSGPTWDWGRAPASEDDDTEVWEDEIGALRSDVSNQCDKR